jgi:hypothetical protein
MIARLLRLSTEKKTRFCWAYCPEGAWRENKKAPAFLLELHRGGHTGTRTQDLTDVNRAL